MLLWSIWADWALQGCFHSCGEWINPWLFVFLPLINQINHSCLEMGRIQLSLCAITAKDFLPLNCWFQAPGMSGDAIMLLFCIAIYPGDRGRFGRAKESSLGAIATVRCRYKVSSSWVTCRGRERHSHVASVVLRLYVRRARYLTTSSPLSIMGSNASLCTHIVQNRAKHNERSLQQMCKHSWKHGTDCWSFKTDVFYSIQMLQNACRSEATRSRNWKTH